MGVKFDSSKPITLTKPYYFGLDSDGDIEYGGLDIDDAGGFSSWKAFMPGEKLYLLTNSREFFSGDVPEYMLIFESDPTFALTACHGEYLEFVDKKEFFIAALSFTEETNEN